MSDFIFHNGLSIECIGNPAQKTQFSIFCEDPHFDDMMVGLPADGRKFANWSDVITAAVSQAGSRIVRIEVYEDLYLERDELEERSDFEKASLVVIATLILFTIYMIFQTIGDSIPVTFRG